MACGILPVVSCTDTIGQEQSSKTHDGGVNEEDTRRTDKVLIPGGWFLMGCREGDIDCKTNEVPAHRVFVRDFYIDRYEVTVEKYKKCVVGGGCSPIRAGDECTMAMIDNESLPVNCVNWHQAQDFCAWAKSRLPTEAEWEKAATYRLDDAEMPNYRVIAWYGETSDGCPHRVGTKKPTAGGLYDMVGNVGEWCSDWYDEEYYKVSPEENPQGPLKGRGRVIRGGSFNDRPGAGARITARIGNFSDSGHEDDGFRCASD